MSIHNKIKNYRKYLGLTQEEVASKAGINEKYYGRIERGESKPTVEYVVKICNAMGIDLLELLLIEETETAEERFVRNPRITAAMIEGLKQDIDIHFNRDVILDGCESCLWYCGYVGSMNFDEFEMKIYAEGNIKGTLYKDYVEILDLNSNDVATELRKYIKSDLELQKVIEFMPYDEEVLKSKGGEAFFVIETNWFTAQLVNNNTGEMLYEDIILDGDNIIDNFKGSTVLFDHIFKM